MGNLNLTNCFYEKVIHPEYTTFFDLLIIFFQTKYGSTLKLPFITKKFSKYTPLRKLDLSDKNFVETAHLRYSNSIITTFPSLNKRSGLYNKSCWIELGRAGLINKNSNEVAMSSSGFTSVLYAGNFVYC